MNINSNKAQHSRSKTIIKLLIINVIAVILIFIGFEIYFRYTLSQIINPKAKAMLGDIDKSNALIAYTPNGRRLIPNAHVVIHNHFTSHREIKMDINSLGFRDDEIAPEKQPNEIRILALGDSITWGDYLQADEVYVERMENYLKEYVKNKNVEVINAGVGDIGLKEEVQILEERGLAAKPDIVTVGFYLNDSRPPWGFPGELGTTGFLRRNSVIARQIYKILVYSKWMKDEGKERMEWVNAKDKLDWKHDRTQFIELTDSARFDWGAGWDDKSWEIIAAEFKKLKEISGKNNFKVVIVAFPASYQVYADFLENKPQTKLAEMSRDFGFYYIDLLPLLREYKNQELFFDQCHPVVSTNDIIGKAIAEYVNSNLLQ